MKRNVFAELVEGFDALKAAREGKITLRQHVVESKPAPKVTASELKRVRARLNLSRYLPTACAPTCARLKAGSKAAPSPTHRQRC
jgi:hypothetical protein